MNYSEFAKNIGHLPGVLLFGGEEEYLKDAALALLRKKYAVEGMEAFNEAIYDHESDLGLIQDACEALPFMAEKRLVIVRDCPFVTGEKTRADGEEALDRFLAYIKDMPAHVIAVFHVRGKPDQSKKLPKAIKSLGGQVDFPLLGEEEAGKWAVRFAGDCRKNMDAQTARLLVSMAGRELAGLKAAVEQAAAYAGDAREINGEDVRAVVEPAAEYLIYQIADSVVSGRSAQACEAVEGLLRRGENALSLLMVFSSQMRRVLYARSLMDTGLDASQIAQKMQLRPYPAQIACRQAGRLSAHALTMAAQTCAKAEFDVKSGLQGDETALYSVIFTVEELFKSSRK